MKKLFLVSFIFFLILAGSARADWVSDWLNSSVTSYTGPSYIEAGRRGYLSFGSVSTRTIMSSDRLITFTPPSINFGCGGIDIFMGGFSFLDFDYMVDKFQRIISAAPAFAFEYALRSICEQCGTIMDSLSSIQDLLNTMQLDDCQASRALGYWMASLGKNQYAAMRETLKPVIAKTKIVSGTVDSWKEWLDDKLKNAAIPGQTTNTENQETNRDCPAYLMELLNAGSLVHYVREKYFSALGAPFEALVRGYLGDVVFYQSNGLWFANYVGPCGSINTSDPLKAMVSGDVLVNLTPNQGNINCQAYTSAFPSEKPLGVLVYEKLLSAYSKLATGGTLTADESNLIALLPSPVYRFLKQLYIYDAPAFAVSGISDTASYGLAYSLLAMTYAEMQKALLYINEFVLERCATQVPAEGSCMLCETSSVLKDRLEQFKTYAVFYLDDVKKSWNNKLAEFNKDVNTTLVLLQAIDSAVKAKMAKVER